MAAYWIWCIDQACYVAAVDVEDRQLAQAEQQRSGKQTVRFVSGPRGWMADDD